MNAFTYKWLLVPFKSILDLSSSLYISRLITLVQELYIITSTNSFKSLNYLKKIYALDPVGRMFLCLYFLGGWALPHVDECDASCGFKLL